MYATVSEFDGKRGVDFREWYAGEDFKTKETIMLPGQKGIRLTVEHWEALTRFAGDITEALGRDTGKEPEADGDPESDMSTGE